MSETLSYCKTCHSRIAMRNADEIEAALARLEELAEEARRASRAKYEEEHARAIEGL